jgi:hypothetical protein
MLKLRMGKHPEKNEYQKGRKKGVKKGGKKATVNNPIGATWFQSVHPPGQSSCDNIR